MSIADKPLPDSGVANNLGCPCPIQGNGGHGKRGEGELIDGVRSWTIDPKCRIHSDPRWWMSRHQGAPK